MTLSLLADCVSQPPASSLEEHSMSKWKVQSWVSSLPPVIANIYMQILECRMLTTIPLKLSLWLHYVDDAFDICKHGDRELQGFLEHLNDQCAEIHFTMERESKGSIPFVDVYVKKEGSKPITSVYRMPNHTDHYLYYCLNHHLKVKSGIVDCPPSQS